MAVIATLMLAIAAPASAQFFFGRSPSPPPGPPSDFPFFDPFQRIRPRATGPVGDFSRAPPAKKTEVVPERTILVLGDAMADWLAYGLEDALSETPDIGVIRKHKTVSGLIRYQPKGDPTDWAAAAKGILATEKASVVVIMLGLNDRMEIREPVVEKPKSDSKKTDKPERKDTRAVAAKPSESGASNGASPAAPPAPAADAELAPADDAESEDIPSIAAPERSARTASGAHEFRSPKWVELYTKKIEEMNGILKAKGVPVLWVGLPAIRGQRSTADMLFLNALYREGASKSGIPYVDVWDGFVDESGRFLPQGADVEGQTRRLRAADGVYFTKAGARKLAHYVEREIHRVLATKAVPVALPSEPGTPDINVRPGGPAPRPIAGPIVPLVASSVGTDELLGGAGTRPAAVDALAARTLVKGEPLAAPAGRADDFAWPRREIGALDPAVANAPEPASPGVDGDGVAKPRQPAAKAARPRPSAPPPGLEPRRGDGAPRPPGSVGTRSTGGGFFFVR